MLRLQKNQTTKIALTLKEKATASIYYPFFRFIQVAGNNVTSFHLEPIESSQRFDLFEYESTMVEGSYDYEVYQSETETDTDYENMVLLESGQLEVYE